MTMYQTWSRNLISVGALYPIKRINHLIYHLIQFLIVTLVLIFIPTCFVPKSAPNYRLFERANNDRSHSSWKKKKPMIFALYVLNLRCLPCSECNERIDVTRRTQRRRETHVDPYESVADLNKHSRPHLPKRSIVIIDVPDNARLVLYRVFTDGENTYRKRASITASVWANPNYHLSFVFFFFCV